MDELIIANTILFKAFQESIPITPMKLQKLIYLVYREYLKKTKNPLFSERFEAWQYGPVLSRVYSQFKKYKSSSIKDYCPVDEKGTVLVYSLKDKTTFSDIFDDIWCKYKDIGAIELSSKTHQPDSAWSKAVNDHKFILSDEDIMGEEWD